VIEGPESLRSLPLMSKLDTELAADANDGGGPPPSAVDTENTELFAVLDNRDVPRVDVLFRFFSIASTALSFSGTPSHFVLTFGTFAGSF
jgi:hypothetical protein